MSHTFKLVYMAVTALILGFNVRIPGRAKIEELYQDIYENGLQVPISAYQMDADAEVIAGHLRTQCVLRLYEEDRARYEELFPNGMPVNIIEGVTYEQAQELKVDHGNENPLLDPMEAQLCADLLFDNHKTEMQVAVKLAGLLDRLKPMKANRKKELTRLQEDLKLYNETGKFEQAADKQKEIDEFLLKYHKGRIQNMKAVWRCPHIVKATLWYKSTGEHDWPENLGLSTDRETYLPIGLAIDDVKRLSTEFDKDLELVVDGKKIYNKRIPGPNFNARWETIIKRSQDNEGKEPTVRQKAFAKTELEEDEKLWTSQLAKSLAQHHRRDPECVDLNTLKSYDQIAYFAEILAERAPDEWAEAIQLAQGLEKELAANAAEVHAQDAGTTAPPPKPKTDVPATETAATVVNRPNRASKAKAKKAAKAKAAADAKKAAAVK